MADERAEAWLDRYRGLCARRDQWKNIWQQLADLLHPTRGGFTSPLIAGQEINQNIYDSTPMQARRGLATNISALLKDSTSRWFGMKSENEELNEAGRAKVWFDAVEDRMWKAIYAPEARFIQQSAAVDNDIATFGLGYLWINENRKKNNLMFRALRIDRVAIDEDVDGVIDTACVSWFTTARQAAQKWGKDSLGKKVVEALNSTDTKARDQVFEFVQCVYPRDERDTRKNDNKNMPYASLVISKEDEMIIAESGFHEFPIATPRWEVVAGEVYPRSPGMLALPDARTLQAMGQTLLLGGQKAVDPPIWGVDDGGLSIVRTFPGGFTAVSADAVQNTGGRPIGVLDMGKNIPLGRDMQVDVREQVGSAFYKDLFTMPDDAHDETAYRTRERKAQFLRTLGPTLAQLEPDYIAMTVNRVFGIMMRANQFPPPPEELQNTSATFTYKSAIQQAKRQVEMMGLGQGFTFIEPIVAFQPEVVDKLNVDEVMNDMPEGFGFRESWIKSDEEVAQIRQQREQVRQAAMALDAAQGAAGVGKDLSTANKNVAEANVAGQQGQAA